MWYLYAIMLMSIIQILIENKNQIVIIATSLLLLLIKPIIIECYPGFSEYIICDFISFWFYYLLGHYYGEKIINNISSNKLLIALSTLLFVLFNVMLIIQSDGVLFNYYKIITSLTGIVTTVGLFKNIKKNKTLEYFGNKSLSIYVLQGIVIAATRIAIGHLGFLNDPYRIIPLIICTIMGVFIPLLIEIISRKIWKFDFVFYPNKYIKV